MPDCSTFDAACDLPEQIQETLLTLRKHWNRQAKTAIVLGSGLGHFVETLEIEAAIPYEELPHFQCSTAIGHAGRLVCGLLNGTPVIVLQGRCHLYEGHHWNQVTYPMQVLQAWGIRILVLSCAAGGLAPDWNVGDLMIIEDHLNFNMHRASTRHGLHVMERATSPYCPRLLATLSTCVQELQIPSRPGVYIGVTGPNYETRAEQRMFRMLGDAIGMSTIPEAIVAHRLGIQTCAIATITNLCNPDQPVTATGDHVVEAAARAEPRFRRLVTEFLSRQVSLPTG